jgi:uncharacterized surface protein with fasciclin (FAS1) repeats
VFLNEVCTFSLCQFKEFYMIRSILSMVVGSAFIISTSLANAAEDIVDTAVAAGNFTTLVTAIKAAGLVDTLKGKGPFTVFAPTDEAFAKVPKADLNALLKDKAKLTAVLTYHVVPAKVMAKDVKAGDACKFQCKNAPDLLGICV